MWGSVGNGNAVAPFALGAVEGSVGGFEQNIAGRPVLGQGGDSHGNSNDANGLSVMKDGKLANFRANAFRAGLRRLDVGHGEQDDEFLATKAADDIFGSNAFYKKGCGFAKDGVAGIVTVSVVEFLEVVEIEHEDAESGFGADGASGFALHHFFEVTAVEQAGERIADRLVAQRFAQTEIGDRQGNLLGEGGSQQQFRFCQVGRGNALEMEDADGFALRHERNADIGVGERAGMAAFGGVIAGANQVHVPDAYGPAVLRAEDRRRQGTVIP